MRSLSHAFLVTSALGLAAAVVAAGACSPDSGAETQPNDGSSASTGKGATGSGGGGGSTTTSGAGGSDIELDASVTDANLEPDSACATSSAEATLTKKPVDIVFVVDNSGSMGDNIISVQNNINDNFAAIIGASGIDYRVIMISEHGEAEGPESICIKAPLSGTTCEPVPPQPVNNPPFFFHYSIPVGSHDGLCRVLDSFDGSVKDQFNLAPKGWSEWSRPDAFTVIVALTDDGVSCISTTPAANLDDDDTPAGGDLVAAAFDKAILSMGPQFGTEMNRNYAVHSIIGLKEKDPAAAAYGPGDPMVTGVCSSAVAPGTGYQALSKLTGGLRFPICEFMSYDVVFQEIAKGVIQGAKIDCEFPIPEPPDGQTIDEDTIVVEYTPSDGSEAQKFEQVESAEKCADATFYIEDETIKLCPNACTLVQNDDLAKINVLFGCEKEAK